MIKRYLLPLLLTLSSYVSFIFVAKQISIFVIISFIPLFILYYYQKLINNVFVYIPSIILTMFLWIYNSLQFIWSEKLVNLKLILAPIGFFVFFVYLISFLYTLFNKANISSNSKNQNFKKLYIIAFIIILLSWIPAWIAEYPTSLDPDTLAQFSQIFNIVPYANGNPLLHTFALKILFSIFNVFTKDNNLIVALISIIFAIVNASVFAYASIFSYKKTNNIIIYIFSVFFYSFISYNVFYSIRISKDTTFTLSTILFIISLDKYFIEQNKKNSIFLLIFGFLFSLLRKNGYPIILAMIILLIPFIRNKKYIKVGLILILVFLTSTITLNSIFETITKKANTDIISIKNSNNRGISLSVKNIIPLQQISYIVYRDWSLTDHQKELIEKIAPLDIIRDTYDMYWADPMLKACEEYGDKSFYQVDKNEYFQLYLELFAKHPFDFIESYYAMTLYYFYPSINHVNLYQTHIDNNEFGFKKIPLISKGYTETIENIYDLQYDIPVINILLSPGIFSCFLVIVLFYFLYSHQYEKYISILPLILNILILITVVPINNEFRYYLPISASLPLFISLLLSKSNNDHKQLSK